MSSLSILAKDLMLWDPNFWIVIGAVVLWFVVLAIVATIAKNREDRKRAMANSEHYAERGVPFEVTAELEEVFHDADLFTNRNVRIGQLSREKYGNVDADVYEITYQTYDAGDNESTVTKFGPTDGNESVLRQISQTVVALPIGPHDGLRFGVTRVGGWNGKCAKLFGLFRSLRIAQNATPEEEAASTWFNQHFGVRLFKATTRTRVEQTLDLTVLDWLRTHKHLEFEFADNHLLVWIPGTVVAATAREALAQEAIELMRTLRQKRERVPPLIFVDKPTAQTPPSLMANIFASALGAAPIASIVLIASFLSAFAFGALEQTPLATTIVILIATGVIWLGSAYFLLKLITRRRRNREVINLHDPVAVGSSLATSRSAAAEEAAARRRMRKL